MTVELIPKLVRACFDNDKRTVEAISLMMIKKLKKEHPEISTELAKIISYVNSGSPAYRSVDISTIPVDKETRYALASAQEPISLEDPILNESTMGQLLSFIKEREMVDLFIEEGIIPPTSLLLSGMPGVGKTYIAKWLSFKLNMPLISMDLATSISSYLGRSGQNVKTLFDYAKSFPSILFLDELDAVAKRRDDASDLGELKRLVNVLLKELETWPSSSIVIAATNHPELLDKAIWRRFDKVLEIPMPEVSERKQLFKRHLDKFSGKLDDEVNKFIVVNTENINAADICKMCEHIKRKVLITQRDVDIIAIEELCGLVNLESKDDKKKLCQKVKEILPSASLREISQITGISTSSVNRYLKHEENVDEL